MNTNEYSRWRITVRSEWQFGVGALIGAILLGSVVAFIGPVFSSKPLFLAVLPILMIGAALLVVSLEWAVLALMLVRAGADPVLAGTAVGGSSAGALVNLAIILVAVAFLIRRPSLVPKHVYMTWLPFLVIGIIACVKAPEPGNAVKLWLAWLTVASVHWIAVYLVGQGRRVDDLLRIVVVGSLLPVLIGIAFAALRRGGPPEAGQLDGDGFRLAGAFAHPNMHAFYLLVIIALTLYFWTVDRAANKKFSWMWGCYLGVLLGLLVMTKTRSAWVAVMPMLIVYGWKFDRRFLWAMLVVGPILAMSIPQIRDRLLDLEHGNSSGGYSQLNSYAWRKILWHDAFAFMHPIDWLWGRGFRSFDYYSQWFFSMADGTEWGAHNVYVQLLFDTGVIGFAAYLWAYLYQLGFVYGLWKTAPVQAYLIGATVGAALIVGYSDNMLGYLVYNWYMWFVVGVISAPFVLKAGAKGRLDVKAVPGNAFGSTHRRPA